MRRGIVKVLVLGDRDRTALVQRIAANAIHNEGDASYVVLEKRIPTATEEVRYRFWDIDMDIFQFSVSDAWADDAAIILVTTSSNDYTALYSAWEFVTAAVKPGRTKPLAIVVKTRGAAGSMPALHGQDRMTVYPEPVPVSVETGDGLLDLINILNSNVHRRTASAPATPAPVEHGAIQLESSIPRYVRPRRGSLSKIKHAASSKRRQLTDECVAM
ncbi:hypothetical protein J8273_5766 [Carpediemonas membranifera]|uniref:Uncharacterized protein n=1 Tax=Carpediemonas membranifera TaxID=201153 RepID=A0A8J6ASD5_9EUKA|nr:hypothetical protein J8273_5766 [Carpediemonas membranifera]|eukprot:KAG9392833.1 hypothetical protein J8273_5766 [Carpediemonas membranifera]